MYKSWTNPCFLFLGRAQRKLDELTEQLEIAKLNFQQLGGVLIQDKKKLKEEQEHTRYGW